MTESCSEYRERLEKGYADLLWAYSEYLKMFLGTEDHPLTEYNRTICEQLTDKKSNGYSKYKITE